MLFVACADDDDFSTDGNLRLDFSVDKVSFDTVFSTIGSATKQFKIYNRNDNSLLIESIELVDHAKSGFSMNIDGIKGTRLTNVEILKKDSLFGLIRVTVNPQNVNTPVLIRDSIKFTVNGNVQYLRLEAIGQNVYIWKGETVTKDSVISNTKPLLVYDSVVVNAGAKLSIQEGVKFYMKHGASVNVHGTLKAIGSVSDPVVFRGERFDKIDGDIPYDNVPGQWDGIYFYPGSYNNHLENVLVKNATKGMTFYSSALQQKKAILINTIVQNSLEYGVQVTNSDIDASNCLFVNSSGPVLDINGGRYSFLHCTIANYFRWQPRESASLFINNNSYLLEKCDFINSIIYGSMSEELSFENNTAKPFNYSFTNCLLKTKQPDDSRFTDVILNQDPLFRNVKSNGTFSYNFDLDKGSVAIDKAKREFSVSLPFDLKGRSRLNDANPDIGCYEWVGE